MTYPNFIYSNNGGPYFFFSNATPASSYPTQTAADPTANAQSPSGAVITNTGRTQTATQVYLATMRIEK